MAKKTETTTQINPANVKAVRCIVTSDGMHKSRVGVVERLVKHPVVGKYMRRRTKLMFHDENNVSHVGDEVLIKQTRPLSGRKKHILVEVVRKGR